MSAVVSRNGITGDVGLVADGSTTWGDSETVADWRDVDCGPLALGTGPPRALTGENGGITAGCAGAGAAQSDGDVSAAVGAVGNRSGVENDSSSCGAACGVEDRVASDIGMSD